jgi:tRNA threonylcarbamoyladenosine biosynthesis protein TsaB
MAEMLLLGIDTAGPAGSVALARARDAGLEILGEKQLAGRSYSATLVAAVGELLGQAGTGLDRVSGIAVVNGPGSFTGVRVGLSAVKGLAEPDGIGVVPVSRLAILARKAGVNSAALDAHRNEVFLRVESRELLAGAAEIARIEPAGRAAVCDEAAAGLLGAWWPHSDLVRVEAPTAADLLEFALPQILGGEFVDLALLDGHYLRRSDAEIFGEPGKARER